MIGDTDTLHTHVQGELHAPHAWVCCRRLHHVSCFVAHKTLAEEWGIPALLGRPSHAQRQASSPWRPDNGPDSMGQGGYDTSEPKALWTRL
jgi:hypothetical protein